MSAGVPPERVQIRLDRSYAAKSGVSSFRRRVQTPICGPLRWDVALPYFEHPFARCDVVLLGLVARVGSHQRKVQKLDTDTESVPAGRTWLSKLKNVTLTVLYYY
jgi:hypothetical protein